MAKNKEIIPIYNIHPPSASYTSLSIDVYEKLLSDLDTGMVQRANFEKREISLTAELDLYDTFRTDLFSRKKINCSYVVIEILGEVPAMTIYDEISSVLAVLLNKKNLDGFSGIIYVVPNIAQLKLSVSLSRILIPFCEEQNIALLV